jgi:hypothetical protein
LPGGIRGLSAATASGRMGEASVPFYGTRNGTLLDSVLPLAVTTWMAKCMHHATQQVVDVLALRELQVAHARIACSGGGDNASKVGNAVQILNAGAAGRAAAQADKGARLWGAPLAPQRRSGRAERNDT